MQAPLIGGHPAVDFLNTSFMPEGEVVETIEDGRSLLSWLVSAGLLEESVGTRLTRRFGAKATDATAAEARRLREWTKDWLARWREKPNANYAEELASLNKLLARGASRHEVIEGAQGLCLVERPTIDSADALLTLIALQIAGLITETPPSLVKSCAGDKCSLWFVDRTKAHRRLFCSASACGNRAKVAAFRQRQRRE